MCLLFTFESVQRVSTVTKQFIHATRKEESPFNLIFEFRLTWSQPMGTTYNFQFINITVVLCEILSKKHRQIKTNGSRSYNKFTRIWWQGLLVGGKMLSEIKGESGQANRLNKRRGVDSSVSLNIRWPVGNFILLICSIEKEFTRLPIFNRLLLL
jgi:hypothetical protein